MEKDQGEHDKPRQNDRGNVKSRSDDKPETGHDPERRRRRQAGDHAPGMDDGPGAEEPDSRHDTGSHPDETVSVPALGRDD